MKSHEFIEKLSKELEVLPEEERTSALSYYEEYFSEAADEERAVIKLGTPESVAKNIIKEYNSQIVNVDNTPRSHKRNMSDTSKVILIIVLVLLSPVILPAAATAVAIVIGLICIIFSVFVGIAAVVVTLMLSGYAVAIAGLALVFVSVFAFVSLSLADGMFLMGTGIVLIAVGLAFGLLMTWASIKVVPGLISWFVDLCKLPFKRRKKYE